MQSIYTKFITKDTIRFKYAKGVSSEKGKEFHTFHEIIYFMGGNARFISENIQMTIKPNTLIIIPCETYHQLQIIGSQNDYHRCVFHFLEIADLKELINQSINNTLIIEVNQNFEFLFQQMIALTEQERSETTDSIVMHAVLSLLLNEILNKKYTNIETVVPDTISEKCIAYISENINQPISVDDIARNLNISSSHLAHSFKKQMNISIHQYILKKKLVMAYHKILEGEPAMQAALECGFNDYSGFYKQFKKMYNKTPSNRNVEIDAE